tara:strand:+ start:656 stop:796 length:141 start_codon:yes stop_codon:yes gene_type:complete
MTTVEKIQAALDEITSVLTNDFITAPVRTSLLSIQEQMESAIADLG